MNERTTVRLPAELLKRAKRKAAAEGRTLTALIEEGLRQVVGEKSEETSPKKRKPLPVSKVTGDPDPDDLRKFFRALRRAQRDLDLRPDLYTHYYTREFPVRYHATMDTRRWGPGERLVFEPYTKEVYEETFKWIADHGIFGDSGMGAGKYEDAVISAAR